MTDDRCNSTEGVPLMQLSSLLFRKDFSRISLTSVRPEVYSGRVDRVDQGKGEDDVPDRGEEVARGRSRPGTMWQVRWESAEEFGSEGNLDEFAGWFQD